MIDYIILQEDTNSLGQNVINVIMAQPLLRIRNGLVVIIDSLLIVSPIVGFCNCSMFCCVLLNLSIPVLQSS